MDFGSRLKELRTQAGLTQLQLAQRMGITKSVVSFYELQERTPSPDVLVKLAGIFRVSTDYLLGLDKRETIDISGLSKEDVAIMRVLWLKVCERKTQNKIPKNDYDRPADCRTVFCFYMGNSACSNQCICNLITVCIGIAAENSDDCA